MSGAGVKILVYSGKEIPYEFDFSTLQRQNFCLAVAYVKMEFVRGD